MASISTRTHGILDYAIGGALIAAPSIFHLKGMAAQLPRIIGIGMIGHALTTRYNLGAVRSVPMGAHLTTDVATGAMLAASPFLFGFSGNGLKAWLPHVLAGASAVAVATITDPSTNTVIREVAILPEGTGEGGRESMPGSL